MRNGRTARTALALGMASAALAVTGQLSGVASSLAMSSTSTGVTVSAVSSMVHW